MIPGEPLIFDPTPFEGAFIVRPELHSDDRGFFARTWCQEQWKEQGLDERLVQCSVSFNHRGGTVRGLHFQAEPWPETKLVRCTSGAIWDVMVDLRAESPTLGSFHAVELSAENRLGLWIPAGFAHGFQTLTDDAEVLYQISVSYRPEAARGLRWDDPDLAIPWPRDVTMISDRDRNLPVFRELEL